MTTVTLHTVTSHKVSPIDENHLLYGNFIGLQYVFTQTLDAQVLARAVDELIKQFPALGGRYNARTHSVDASNVADSSDNAKLHISDTQTPLPGTVRPCDFVRQPQRRDVVKGKAPLSTMTLTQFSGGGSIFGMAISHVLTDAAGYHLVAKHLSQRYTAMITGKPVPAFSFVTQSDDFVFGTSRSKTETLNALKARGLAKPIPIKGLAGRVVKSLIIKAMDKSLSDNPPFKLHMTKDDIRRLKHTVLAESGEPWISTHVALCAHAVKIISELSYGDDLKLEIQIGQLIDLRGRYFEDPADTQSRFVGNAILIHIETGAFPDGLQNTSRGDLARYFKTRQTRTTAEDVKTRLDLLADALAHGYTNPELDIKKPIISLNNQSKMPVYDISFSEAKPSRIIPQDVGDNIMFFPAPDGGVDIYIRDIVNPGRQTKLHAPYWQNKIYDF